MSDQRLAVASSTGSSEQWQLQGGGFILADNHGEIPWQVPDGVLTAIAQAVARWGRYPLAADHPA